MSESSDFHSLAAATVPTATIADLQNMKGDAPESEPSFSSKEVAEVEREPGMTKREHVAMGFSATVEQAEVIAHEWHKKCERESVTHYACPFEPDKKKRPTFASSADCYAHMATNFANCVEQHKLEYLTRPGNDGKWDINKIALDTVKIPPKRTLADFYPPHMRDQMLRQEEAGGELKEVLRIAQNTVGGKTFEKNNPIAHMLTTTSEQDLLFKIPHLSTDEIQGLGALASSQGKTPIARKCRQTLSARGAQPKW